MNPVVRWNRWGWLAMVLAMVLASSASAQLRPQQDPRRMMAHQLKSLMDQALGDPMARPTPDQLTQAQILLNMALDLAPDAPALWRAQMHIAQWRGDAQRRREAVTRLIGLEPANDAAQLDMILSAVAQKQTLDDRLALIARVLDAPSSASLSAALRSRLASYAAAAAREMGDMDTFARRLTQAMKLDPANGEAARMAYELALARGDSPLYRGAAAMAWVRGDPADAAARVALGKLLLTQALFEEAAEQFEMSMALSRTAPSPAQVRLWVTALAMAGHSDPALAVLNKVERATGALPAELELMRVAIASMTPAASGDAASQAFSRLREALSALAQSGSEGAARELALASALFGSELDGALQQVEGGGVDPTTRDLVRGWVALRYGREDQGRALLRPLAEDTDLAALGLALLESDTDARASMLETIRTRDPLGLAGMLAVMNLRKDGRPIPPTRIGVSLRELMRRGPARLWYTDLAFAPWLSMRLHVEPMRPGYLEPIHATVVISNLSGAPLSMAARGRAGTIPGQMLVAVSATGADGAASALPPMLIDIGRRLTLEEGQRLEVPFRLDRGPLAALLAANPAMPLSLRATAVIDPRTTAGGDVQAGPVGALDRVRAIQTDNVPPTSENLDAWMQALDSPDGAKRMRSIARLLRALADQTAEPVQPRRDEIGDAIAAAWEGLGALQRAWTLRFLPPPDRMPTGLRRVADLAQRSDDPLIRVTYLASQVRDPTSPAMNAALRHPDPAIGEFARALRDSLLAGQAAHESGGEAGTEQAAPPSTSVTPENSE